MKKLVLLRHLSRMIFLLAAMAILLSCERTRDIQTFDDVFDISGVEKLNYQIYNAKDFTDLSAVIGAAKIIVPESFTKVTPGQLADHISRNLILSNQEIDMLLKNDSRTYIAVINRFGSLPDVMSDISSKDFAALKASELGEYSLKVREEPQNFYSNDYYSAVLAMQTFLTSSVIAPLQAVATVSNNSNDSKKVPPGLDKEPAPGSTIDSFVLISSSKIWDMWWTYWSDGTRTKHKGSAGSFPG